MADKRPLRRCIVCAIRDDPIEPERPVHVRPGRPENAFLPPALRSGPDDAARHEAGSIAEIRAHLAAGIDAFFTDDPALGRRAVDGR